MPNNFIQCRVIARPPCMASSDDWWWNTVRMVTCYEKGLTRLRPVSVLIQVVPEMTYKVSSRTLSLYSLTPMSSFVISLPIWSSCIDRWQCNQIIFEPLSENCRRPHGWSRSMWMKNIQDDLKVTGYILTGKNTPQQSFRTITHPSL